MHDLNTIQHINHEAMKDYTPPVQYPWANSIDLNETRVWYVMIPGDGVAINEIVGTYQEARDLLVAYYADPYDLVLHPGEVVVDFQ